MASKPTPEALQALARLQSAEQTVSSIEATHQWEVNLHKHAGYSASWSQGQYSWGGG